MQWHLKEEKFLMFEQGVVTFLHATLKFPKLLMTQPFRIISTDKGLLSQIGMKVWIWLEFWYGCGSQINYDGLWLIYFIDNRNKDQSKILTDKIEFHDTASKVQPFCISKFMTAIVQFFWKYCYISNFWNEPAICQNFFLLLGKPHYHTDGKCIFFWFFLLNGSDKGILDVRSQRYDIISQI